MVAKTGKTNVASSQLIIVKERKLHNRHIITYFKNNFGGGGN